MNSSLIGRGRSLWRRMSPWDRISLVLLLLYALVWVLGALGRRLPASGLFGILALFGAGYFLIRLLVWVREHQLWSLRNKLVVAYLLIAVVPVLLLILMAGLSAYVIYSQLGAYLIYDDVQVRLSRIASIAETSAIMANPDLVRASRKAPIRADPSTPLGIQLSEAATTLPGVEVQFLEQNEVLRKPGGEASDRFSGLVLIGEKVWMRAEVLRKVAGTPVVVKVSVPVTPSLLDGVAPELSSVKLTITRPAPVDQSPSRTVEILGQSVQVEGQLSSNARTSPPARNWLDYPISGFLQLDAVAMGTEGTERQPALIFAFFTARPSQLNGRLRVSLGETGGFVNSILVAVGIIFLIIEIFALRTGISLTRTITQSVDGLYEATQHVQSGDFNHRIQLQRNDQLGVLAESFNTMTSSISALIEEQRQRQHLESELTIAREVQAQLFPRSLPQVKGLELGAIWRAARTVSGDYYDFYQLSPTRCAVVIADISGKGISAALLMASLQAALRSQLVLSGKEGLKPADLVARLNRHMFLNTSEERYATLFYAVLDTETRTLDYTNAGHLPPLYVVGDQVKKLEAGGMVVGLFSDCEYQQGTIEIEPEGLFVAYTDGLTEPENVYGEEFGARRVVEQVFRYRHSEPRRLAQLLVNAAEEWAGTPEQADDITVIVAGFK